MEIGKQLRKEYRVFFLIDGLFLIYVMRMRLKLVRPRLLLAVGIVSLLCPRDSCVAAFTVGNSKHYKKDFRSRGSRLKGIVNGDDFAGFSLIGDGDLTGEDGRRLASEFYREVQLREQQIKKPKIGEVAANKSPQAGGGRGGENEAQTEKSTTEASAGLFQKGKQRMIVYSDRSSSGAAKNTGGLGRMYSSRQKSVPLPPAPRHASPTQLSVSGAIAVVLLSRYFWVQALIGAGLVAFYIAMVAMTSNGGVDWMTTSSSLGGWLSPVSDGAPVIERSVAQQDVNHGNI